MCKLYHLFPDGTERREKSSEALESPGRVFRLIRSPNTLRSDH